MARDLSQVALGSWSGGRFMNFGTPAADDELATVMRPDDRIPTLVTADVYGAGAADELLRGVLSGLPREDYCLAGAIGHDFYTGERQGAKGFQRFTDPALRGEDEYADYLKMAAEKSLERLGLDHFDLLMLHNPDHIGYTSEAVWDGMDALRTAGLATMIGVAPGPANGFTLDIINCLERFGDRIDWAMLILNPFEPWPGELALPAAERHDVKVLARVVDYGGIFHDDLKPGMALGERDHRAFRPAGWIEAASARLEQMRPIADRHGLTMLQLACLWDLAHPAVQSVVPTLVQELGGTKSLADQREELATLPTEVALTADELAEIRAIGDNTGCMALKGGVPDHDGAALADRWQLDDELLEIADRWAIDASGLRNVEVA